MIILGIDPGTARVGYGVIKKEGGKVLFLDAGILKIKKQEGQHIFLQIKIRFEQIIKKNKP